MLNWDASSSLIRPQPGSRLRQLTAKFRVLFPQPFEFGLQCAWIVLAGARGNRLALVGIA